MVVAGFVRASGEVDAYRSGKRELHGVLQRESFPTLLETRFWARGFALFLPKGEAVDVDRAGINQKSILFV